MKRPLWLFRCSLRNRTDQSELLGRLNAAGIEIESSNLAKGAWKTRVSSPALRELADRGEIYVQDEASQLVAELVEARDGDRVLDLCAAPGGKTTLIADRTNNARLIACDISERRLRTVAKAVANQGIRGVSLVQLDATRELPFDDGSFERVLVDAPCSGTGTLRHNPEIRWRITEEDIQRLAKQQSQILTRASKVLRPGGRLVYSTCSVEPEENEAVVKTFLESNKDFRQVVLGESGSLRTWPQWTMGFCKCVYHIRLTLGAQASPPACLRMMSLLVTGRRDYFIQR